MEIYWDKLWFEKGLLYIAATSRGLIYLGGPNETFEDMQYWIAKHFTEYELAQDEQQLKPYMNELNAYFSGKLQVLRLPIHLIGTDFQLAVWSELQKIPFGETVSYSQIAEQIGKPSAVRAVGGAIRVNPIMVVVPCHRVIGKNGKLTGFRGGMEMKEYLLTLEGVQYL